MIRLHIMLLGIAIFCTSPARTAADIFTVADSDFLNGVYDFTYFSTTNKAYLNGVEMPFSSLVMGNTGLTGPAPEGGGAYWHANGYYNATQLSGDMTLGWDFSAVTKNLQQVELLTNAALFQFNPWTAHAFEDKLYGEVATPTIFGGGPYSRYFEYEGNNSTQTTTNFGQLQDVTTLLSNSWLANPDLFELRLGYQQHAIDGAHPNIPGKHLQVFRNNLSGGEGFRLRVAAANSAAVPEPSAVAGLLMLGAVAVLKRRSQKRMESNS